MKTLFSQLITVHKIFAALVFTFLFSVCVAQGQVPAWAQERFKEYDDKYELSDFLNPPFLEGQLSGSKKTDIALAVERKIDKKKGIVVFFADSKKSFLLGAGNRFGDGGDDFSWAGTWAIYDEETAEETTFNENGDVAGTQVINLRRPAITLKEKTGTGGLIYFEGKRFVWIHQGD